MNFDLTEDQQLVKETVRRFAEKQVKPTAKYRDEHAIPPLEEIKALAAMGFYGMTIPEEYGGSPLDEICEAIVIEELARADASMGVIMAVHAGLHSRLIVKWGTEEQKQAYLPRLASGEWMGAFCLSEAEAGSDATRLRARARKSGNTYILNGQKSWVTSGSIANLYVLMARTDPDVAPARGVSAFLVEKSFPGLIVGKKEDKMGIRSSDTVELVLDDCQVPAANLLGKENEGIKVALSCLDASRIGVAAQSLGLAQAAYEEGLAYAQERKTFGKKIIHHQSIGNYLADMHCRVEAARLLTYKAAFLSMKGRSITREAAMAKMVASETAMWVADRALQIHGGYGYTKDFPIERIFRDARVTQIYEGTSEIQRMVIARNLV